MTKTLTTIAAALALLAMPAAAQARVPPGFIGVSPQGHLDESDFELMAKAGIRNVRMPLYWMGVEPRPPWAAEPDWSHLDYAVELAARYRMRVMPFVWGSPSWAAPEPLAEPSSLRQRRAWSEFLRRAVRRYGPNGDFWRIHRKLPRRAIRVWEIWNEQNIVSFGKADPRRFARLIRTSGRALRSVDPGARLILGGLFGRPLQVPPNMHIGPFMDRFYRAGDVKRWFDGVALHPYVAQAVAMRGQIRNLRRVMRRHGDGGTRLYLTEMGWGSNSFQSRWERGPRGQAREMNHAFSLLARHRGAWRIGGAWWFTWADARGGCQFCDSAGLLTERREAKPAWYVFNSWTRGDASIVPRAAGFPPQASIFRR